MLVELDHVRGRDDAVFVEEDLFGLAAVGAVCFGGYEDCFDRNGVISIFCTRFSVGKGKV